MKKIHRSEWLAYIKWRIMKWWRSISYGASEVRR